MVYKGVIVIRPAGQHHSIPPLGAHPIHHILPGFQQLRAEGILCLIRRLHGRAGLLRRNAELLAHIRRQLGIPVILVIEVEGAGNIKKMYPGATTIFVLPPDMQELERRLRCRGTEDEETIQRRLKRAEAEIANSVNYDEHVVNIEVDSCAESIYSIIQFKLQHGSDE